MTVNRDSWLVKWAYLTSDHIPHRTTLCALFWRSILWTPLAVCAFLCFCAIVAAIVGFAAVFTSTVFAVSLVAIGGELMLLIGGPVVVLSVANAVYWLNQAETRDRLEARVAAHPLIVGAAAVKSRYCPIVEIRF